MPGHRVVICRECRFAVVPTQFNSHIQARHSHLPALYAISRHWKTLRGHRKKWYIPNPNARPSNDCPHFSTACGAIEMSTIRSAVTYVGQDSWYSNTSGEFTSGRTHRLAEETTVHKGSRGRCCGQLTSHASSLSKEGNGSAISPWRFKERADQA